MGEPSLPVSAAMRGVAFLGLWLVIDGVDAAGLAIGLGAAGLATWASLHLMPPGAGRLRPVALAALVGRLAWQSVVAGFDVARRALAPQLRLRPGLVTYPQRLPPGAARNAFGALSSLVPGTLPCGSDGTGALVVHCLDAGPEVVAQLADDELRLAQALGREDARA